MTLDEVVAAAWKIADNDECDGVTFDAGSDQWWSVVILCRHGSYHGTSDGQLDAFAAFSRALAKFSTAHPAPGKPA